MPWPGGSHQDIQRLSYKGAKVGAISTVQLALIAWCRACRSVDYLPRKHGDYCLQELRWLYDKRDLTETKADLAAWLAKWSGKYPRLTGWAEETIEQILTFFHLPRQHQQYLKSTTCSNASTRKSAAETTSCVSSQIPRAACASSGHLPSKPMKTGWRPSDRSTWTTSESTRSSNCERPHDQRHDRPICRT
ncbi:transposase (fragment) [uncultured Pleomorphomonas sp.]|uniref:Transposase n=1 Tax=uncultured Pleomorphomonas sp. TaxID=442121 RepID=A0A212LG30_9HYPH